MFVGGGGGDVINEDVIRISVATVTASLAAKISLCTVALRVLLYTHQLGQGKSLNMSKL